MKNTAKYARVYNWLGTNEDGPPNGKPSLFCDHDWAEMQQWNDDAYDANGNRYPDPNNGGQATTVRNHAGIAGYLRRFPRTTKVPVREKSFSLAYVHYQSRVLPDPLHDSGH